MNVPGGVCAVTIVAIVGLLAFDFVFHVRKAHVPALKEAAVWSAGYIGVAVLFGVGVVVFGGVDAWFFFFAAAATEKALSVDNLFVFLILIASFRVPREDQQKVLLFGIVFSLIARTGFIFLGAALITTFAWVFYLFGLVLLLTAGNMFKPESSEESHTADNIIVRLARKVFHTTDYYDVDKLFTIRDGKRAMTPMLLVMVGDRWHRRPVRSGLDPGDLRPHAKRVHRLHRDGVLAAGSAAALLPHRRPARPADLPVLRSGGHPGVHRREADPACPTRKQRRVHQRRPARQCRRDQHRPVPVSDPRCTRRHRGRVGVQ